MYFLFFVYIMKDILWTPDYRCDNVGSSLKWKWEGSLKQ